MVSASKQLCPTDQKGGNVPAALVEAMSNPGFYPHPVAGVEHRETHISRVFLAGDFVYKIKKPISLEFLDFSTLEKRYTCCLREVSLNRRLAPDVYMGIVPISCYRRRYRLGKTGSPVEFAVHMHRLSEDRSLLHLLRRKQIDETILEQLARQLVDFYRRASSGSHINRFGSLETIKQNCEENFRQIQQFGRGRVDKHLLDIVVSATRAYLDHHKELFRSRIAEERIRDCHGDLRCGHVYFEQGIQIIDCIEFNDRFRFSDSACDLAFLIMDMEYEGFPDTANSLVDAVARYSGDSLLYVMLDFYKCYRAMVKSKVCYITIQGSDRGDFLPKKLQREADKYLNLAYRYAVKFSSPTLWVMCGLPASGKSTIAKSLSKRLGIPLLRSDAIRKELFGPAGENPKDMPFARGLYSPGTSSLTYGKLMLTAQDLLERGQSVILDATFSRRHHRREALKLAQTMDSQMILVEAAAPAKILKARLKERDSRSPLSDARLTHFNHFVDAFEPVDDIPDDTHILIDTTKPSDEMILKLMAHRYHLPARAGFS